MSHSPISPSSANQWVNCTGMVKMVEGLSSPTNDSAVEGDTAHWLAGWLMGERSIKESDMIGYTAPSGHIIDKEMFDYITPYVNDVVAVTGKHLAHVEQCLQMPNIHEKAFGTPDCWYYDPDTNILHVWDLKYGWGIVEVYENWQFLMYAVGIIESIGLCKINSINIHLVQPRPYHEDGPCREWSIGLEELMPYEERLVAAAHEALSDNGTLCSGTWCKHCLARATCSADRHASMNSIDVAFAPIKRDTLNYDYELSVLERAKDSINQRYDALVEHVKELIRGGTQVPGRSLVSAPGRGSKWVRTTQEIVTLGTIYGISLEKPQAVLTPNQAIKVGIPKDIMEGYSQKNPPIIKLVKDDQRKVKELLT